MLQKRRRAAASGLLSSFYLSTLLEKEEGVRAATRWVIETNPQNKHHSPNLCLNTTPHIVRTGTENRAARRRPYYRVQNAIRGIEPHVSLLKKCEGRPHTDNWRLGRFAVRSVAPSF